MLDHPGTFSDAHWRINELYLPVDDKMGAESWEVLSKVASNGKVGLVRVSESALLRAANNQQVEALWRATDKKIIAKMHGGDAGLQKFFTQVKKKALRKCSIL